ncbi:hypothetical protein SAMN04488107_2465 [Geodermatophilus saharensis]|uniref:DUF2269 domain-containing protein n=1 Tax=Geodermatophilus saharensis TaxID=1137994 RepID=A0A239EAH7_9ACTN|nr:hypothetical protein [Geodermatophilus saharensis]SNS41695.1 hypothetical protein SAMN04488107_2465 [Geodermatophilus saharensis]
MAGTTRSLRLPPHWRRALVVVHVGSSVGLLGADAAVLTLDLAGATGADPPTVYPAAALLGSVLLVPLALVSLTSGVLLGLLTPWGLLRHWWVALKLVLTTAGTVLALVVLTPSLDAAAGAALAPGPLGSGERWALVRDSAAASGVLVTTLVLSVVKPFGRVRRRRPA